MKHTPGPWTVVSDESVGTYIACDTPEGSLQKVSGEFFNPADAALIAAAPELHESLWLILELVKENFLVIGKRSANAKIEMVLEDARAVLAKATGGAA